MQVILQGSLRHFAADELLPFLARRNRKGTLDIISGAKHARILFEDSRVLWAEATGASDATDAVVAALGWLEGSFTLLDSFELPENARPFALDVAALIEEAKKRADAYTDETSFHVVDDPTLQQQVSLTAEEFRLLFKLAPGKSFRELLAELTMPRNELADRLKRLEGMGLVTVQREEPVLAPMDKTPPISTKTTIGRKRTMVGSLTPDGAPDNVYPLLDPEYTIGRAPDNAIPIADGSVSSRHARIIREPQGFVLEDLQSRNGTFVNGERLAEKRLLADGDLIRLGKVIMTFNVARETKAGETTEPEVRFV